MFTFKLIEKTYKNERYEATPFHWKGHKLKPIVRMWYHTKLRYWDVSYDFRYGKGFTWTVTIKSEGMLNRKEARSYATTYMRDAKRDDVERLSTFNKNSILEKS